MTVEMSIVLDMLLNVNGILANQEAVSGKRKCAKQLTKEKAKHEKLGEQAASNSELRPKLSPLAAKPTKEPRRRRSRRNRSIFTIGSGVGDG